MRLWHKDLISVLPRKQLVSQWRECCCIARNIAVNGSPNHLLVNKIMDYSQWHFMQYTIEVCKELERRGYKIARYKFFLWFDRWNDKTIKHEISHNDIFSNWHNYRYYEQCYFNLQEKFDCGGISEEEFHLIEYQYMQKRIMNIMKNA